MAESTSQPNLALMERRGAVARVLINRPPLNILDVATIRELRVCLEAALGAEETLVVEIRGAGEKAFSAGAEVRDHFPERAPEMLKEFHALIRSVLYAPRPTVAVVRGHCLGGGMELAVACDFVLASEDARFGQPEIKLGAFPPVAASLLARLMPEKKALEVILTGEPITGEEAFRWGLVNHLSEPQRLDWEAEKFIETLGAKSPCVLALARKAARLESREAFESALREAERIYLDELLVCHDAREGLTAFLEKRTPVWKRR